MSLGRLGWIAVGCAAALGAAIACASDDSLDRVGGGGAADGGETDAGSGDASADTGADRVPDCGDGMLDPGEQCDGDELGNRDCENITGGFIGGALACLPTCEFDTRQCTSRAGCGNGKLDTGEECDGEVPSGETCVSRGFVGGVLVCGANCNFDETDCTGCGNDVVESGEECDGTDLAGETCTSRGFVMGALACDADCTFDETDCAVSPDCPNGSIDPPEECESSDLNSATCVSLGHTDGALACTAACRYDESACTDCPDGVSEGTEECDGSNLAMKTCETEGFTGGVLRCAPDCTLDPSGCTECGNGVIEQGETCDTMAFGIHTCASEGLGPGTLVCTSSCTLDTSGCSKCGNAMIDPPEECDGANLDNQGCVALGYSGGTLACTPSCTFDETGCSNSCNPLTQATWYRHHAYNPPASTQSLGVSQFLVEELAATRFDLPVAAFPLTITHLRIFTSTQSYTARIYLEGAGQKPGTLQHSEPFTGDGSFKVVALSTPVNIPIRQPFWVALQGQAMGMLVTGDNGGESTQNLIYGCDAYFPGLGCLGTWDWRTFNSYGGTFAQVDDLIISVGSCP